MRPYSKSMFVFTICFAGFLFSAWVPSLDAHSSPNHTNAQDEANQLSASARGALKDFETVQSEVNSFLTKLATDRDYATQVKQAADKNNEKAIRGLLLTGGIKQGQIEETTLDPKARTVRIRICWRGICVTITVSTSSK